MQRWEQTTLKSPSREFKWDTDVFQCNTPMAWWEKSSSLSRDLEFSHSLDPNRTVTDAELTVRNAMEWTIRRERGTR